jgi:hypothetical protein
MLELMPLILALAVLLWLHHRLELVFELELDRLIVC